jgi:hypothetical protein
LAGSLNVDDVHVVDPTWSKTPVAGHGTEMAGLALFGDLEDAVTSGNRIVLLHRLESVKFLPDAQGNDPDLYGAITAQAVDRPEIQAPHRPRVFMMAVTAAVPVRPSADDTKPPAAGKPTSWSSAIDALAYGRAIEEKGDRLTLLDRDEAAHPRLFVISAGNIRDLDPADDHLDRSDLEPVEDPAQAWNAITVGAYTEKDDMDGAHPSFKGYTPVASRGELSPTSRTSVLFQRRKPDPTDGDEAATNSSTWMWPFKPEVVAEGGNVAASPDRTQVDTPDNLAVLTTRLQLPGQGYFTTTRDTSAATAQVAAIAADIEAAYPGLRPETVRALVVHSAEWTEAMLGRIDRAANKTEAVNLLRRYGMGVPSLGRALRSASDALTLVVESTIRPFMRHGQAAAGTTREMNLHRLPWPADVLEQMGEADVRLRITLSYFIEPNPSSRGWNGRYAYPSFGLRFAMRRPEESVDGFRKRINKKARGEGEKNPRLSTEKGWLFGADQQQAPGSLHTDIWTGSAADLASKGAIAVYPVGGWWKTRPRLDQSDQGVPYSLVASIESPEVDADLWTPVAQMVMPEITITS